MRKYWHVINIGIQNTLVYRVNFLFRAAFSLVPLAAMLMVWQAIYAGKSSGGIGSYAFPQMVSYYLLITLVDLLTAVTEDDWQIATDIKDGNISQFLVKPMDYMAYRFCLFLAGRLIYTVVALLPVGLFILWHRENFIVPHDPVALGLFIVSLMLTALLQFLMSFTMACLAFWVVEVATFIFILFAFEYLGSGHLFPLDILPPALVQVLHYSPFPYLLFFPVSIYLGKVSGPELGEGLLIQILWVIIWFGLARFAWKRGVRKYSAVGG